MQTFELNEQEINILVVLLGETLRKEVLSNTTKLIYEKLQDKLIQE